jgi:predicted alpha/beta hydrolase family esterase
MTDLIILPGFGGSGEAHWQTHWEQSCSSARRFEPASWIEPDLADWYAALDRAVAEASSPPLLVAHSLACLLVAHWQNTSALQVAGAFLVAVPDPESPSFPAAAAEFAELPPVRFRFPSLIVASCDDPYGDLEYAGRRALEWGSGLIQVGALGHINSQSGLGGWAEGVALLQAFSAGTGCACLLDRSRMT